MTDKMNHAMLRAIDQAVGNNVKNARRAAGYSQTKLGRACNVSFQQIQKYETGANRIAASRLVQIAMALDVAPQALISVLEFSESAAAA